MAVSESPLTVRNDALLGDYCVLVDDLVMCLAFRSHRCGLLLQVSHVTCSECELLTMPLGVIRAGPKEPFSTWESRSHVKRQFWGVVRPIQMHSEYAAVYAAEGSFNS